MCVFKTVGKYLQFVLVLLKQREKERRVGGERRAEYVRVTETDLKNTEKL